MMTKGGRGEQVFLHDPLLNLIPGIEIPYNLMSDMQKLTDLSAYELGWLIMGTIQERPEGDVLVAKEIVVPPQEVNETNTSLTAEALNEFMKARIEAGETQNLYLGWFHSHVDLYQGLEPSFTDIVTLSKQSERKPYFMGGISHQSDGLRIDLCVQGLFTVQDACYEVTGPIGPCCTDDEILAVIRRNCSYVEPPQRGKVHI